MYVERICRRFNRLWRRKMWASLKIVAPTGLGFLAKRADCPLARMDAMWWLLRCYELKQNLRGAPRGGTNEKY